MVAIGGGRGRGARSDGATEHVGRSWTGGVGPAAVEATTSSAGDTVDIVTNAIAGRAPIQIMTINHFDPTAVHGAQPGQGRHVSTIITGSERALSCRMRAPPASAGEPMVMITCQGWSTCSATVRMPMSRASFGR
jgi:hypothetical protein